VITSFGHSSLTCSSLCSSFPGVDKQKPRLIGGVSYFVSKFTYGLRLYGYKIYNALLSQMPLWKLSATLQWAAGR
jgi:hypothetical protein